MSNTKDEKEPAFKVVDKRRFDEEGHEKEGIKSEEPLKNQEEKNAPSPKDDSSLKERPPINFSLFIQSLAHQAMMGLGIVPWPDSKLIRKELNLARETIDLLHLLKTKTTGNLDKDEEALLNGLLYQLQVAFVEISQEPVKGNDNGPGSIIT